MKSPAFQWYAADYLADERVMQLSLESEAAYVRLLNYCWREGSIPANATQCAPMCKYADVKVIKPALALFMKSPTQSGRLIHKRLEEERSKQEEYRAKQSAKGKAGGRPRKADEKPEESHGKATALPRFNHGLTEGDLNKSSLSSTSSSNTTDVVAHAPAAALPAAENRKTAARRSAADAGADTYPAEQSPLYKPEPLQAYYTELVKLLPGLDWGWYVAEMRLKAPADELTAPQWRNWIINFVKNEGAGYRRVPALLPNQVASNAAQPFVPMGIPDKESYLKPQPAGQYTGSIN